MNRRYMYNNEAFVMHTNKNIHVEMLHDVNNVTYILNRNNHIQWGVCKTCKNAHKFGKHPNQYTNRLVNSA